MEEVGRRVRRCYSEGTRPALALCDASRFQERLYSWAKDKILPLGGSRRILALLLETPGESKVLESTSAASSKPWPWAGGRDACAEEGKCQLWAKCVWGGVVGEHSQVTTDARGPSTGEEG
jgi:hypothetical protein